MSNETSEISNKRDAIKKAILQSLSCGTTVKAACEGADIARKTFYEWLKSDEEFRNAVKDNELSAISAVEDALWAQASSGHPASMMFYLCNRAPNRWKNPMKPDAIAQDEQAKLVVSAIRNLISIGNSSVEPVRSVDEV